VLRQASASDAEDVASVLIESRRAFLPFAPSAHSDADIRRWVREFLVPAGGTVVWEVEGQVVGVLSTSVHGGIGWIDQLYLMPGFTRLGIGTKLVAHAHQVLPRPIRLYTFQANTRARRFYERIGYRVLELSDGQNNEERCPDVLLECCSPQAEA